MRPKHGQVQVRDLGGRWGAAVQALQGEAARRAVRWLAVAATVGMYLVLIMGATVTNTGSAQGCGKSWPLCHGQFIPTFAVSTAIEFSHRAVTGIESVLILALAAGAWVQFHLRREIRWLVPLMVFFLFLQAALGALAVEYPTSSAVLAFHFGISLSAFASVLLTTLFLFDVRGAERVRDLPLAPGLRRLIWLTLGYTYVVVYLGAYVRHSNATLACLDWPLCQGQVFPGFSGPVGIVFIHRLAAGLAVLLVAALVLRTRRERATRPDLYRGSLLALVLILLQAAEGALIVYARMDLFSTLAHAGIVTLLFGVLSVLCLRTLPRPAVLPLAEMTTPADRAAVSLEPGHAGR